MKNNHIEYVGDLSKLIRITYNKGFNDGFKKGRCAKMVGDMKLVEFENWCPKCKHINVEETEEPCNECLTYPAAEDSHKPIKFEEK